MASSTLPSGGLTDTSVGRGWRLRACSVRVCVSGNLTACTTWGVSMSGDQPGGKRACDQEVDLERERGLAVRSTHFFGLLVQAIV